MEANAIEHYLPFLFPVFFAAMWLVVSTLLDKASGWYALARRYPDRDEKGMFRLLWQSGSMGPGVSMRGILNIDVCPSGLRLGMMKLFGPFCRNIFVPWNEIKIERKKWFLFWNGARLQFGSPAVGNLTLFEHTADRLARASEGRWPEPGPFVAQTRSQIGASMMKQWAFTTVLASLFFIVGPRLAPAGGEGCPPTLVCIAFPATVFGFLCLFGYWRRVKNN